MSTTSGRERWILEVVRGRNVGRRYQVGTGETPIGNALAGAQGFDLADQESNSPRRMAGRHACLTAAGDALSIRDLESPGGTFVNRQRLLAGQVQPLQPGDLIQVGGVQLEVKRAGQLEAQPSRPSQPQPLSQPQVQPRPAALSIPFTIPGGSEDCEKDFPSGAWVALRTMLRPRHGDAVILCGSDREETARLGALAAALTLL